MSTYIPTDSEYYMSSGFGNRDLDGDGVMKFHPGADYWMPEGSKVFSPVSGRIVYTGFRGTNARLQPDGSYAGGGNYGNVIIIEHLNANGVYEYHLLGHLQEKRMTGYTDDGVRMMGS